ncbi:hypothetical protein M404DRAFT_749100 [Pisolithus tinctorius Marx 270]|uniref:Uncharacterized protein n=1 Tax=Pisolithus tinctorius Marx 270 TaxID=870435 RepID=A0A0C3PED9_PISTI|nr:hypothetical protein M404DRAFT_749100 [Pisolithus tinctorius Marx 270]
MSVCAGVRTSSQSERTVAMMIMALVTPSAMVSAMTVMTSRSRIDAMTTISKTKEMASSGTTKPPISGTPDTMMMANSILMASKTTASQRMLSRPISNTDFDSDGSEFR